jgi:hypothetical protein
MEWAILPGCGKVTIAELERVFGPLARCGAQPAIAGLEREYRYALQAYLAAFDPDRPGEECVGAGFARANLVTEISRPAVVREVADRLGVSTEVVNDLIAAAEGREPAA